MPSLTKYMPSQIISNCDWTHISGLELADNELLNNDPIDLIIGADLFGQIIIEGVRKGSAHEPVAQNTKLGWIISGPVHHDPTSSGIPVHIHHTIFETLDADLRRFWEVEELPRKSYLNAEEQECDAHFVRTHTRDSNGRYLVRLPFRRDPPIQLGQSRAVALASLHRVEQRFEHKPNDAREYKEFMAEYEKLGHMAPIPGSDLNADNSQCYYIPHHAVLRDSSATTRLRVVFNASSRTTNGTSLNDHLYIGPKLQSNLAAVILRWRQFQYVYTADIAKMYRQVWIDARDTEYQRIVWRATPGDVIQDYRLLTVTYGTAAAPYLALRVLKQLAIDEGPPFPLARAVLDDQTYVDDCVFGADDKILAITTRDQLITLMGKGGFRLRKWASNSPDLLEDIDPSDHGLACNKQLQADESLKILGISWHPKSDIFQFQLSLPKTTPSTKRAILSLIARFYDPLGWTAPVIVTAKILMQRLWSLKCDWDEPLQKDCLTSWLDYHAQLPCLEKLKIPRWTRFGSDIMHTSLHGFSDASTKAYAAVAYLRLVHVDGSVTVSFLAAKSRVAPLKTMTVPRLELSAALLLAQLIRFVQSSLHIITDDCHCWTDSSITLAWLSQSPSRWKTFVANRVAEIQTLLPATNWHFVPSEENPADCASRGLAANEILNFSLWWAGPSWLTGSMEHWPDSRCSASNVVPLEERHSHAASNAQVIPRWELADRISSWPRLLRVTAYVLRFARRARRIATPQIANSQPGQDALDVVSLHTDEINSAYLFWIRTIQAECFHDDIVRLKDSRPLAKSSSLASLNPYFDADGLLRIRGRLHNSRNPDVIKHPIILKSHPLLFVIIQHHHLKTLHGGPRLTLASVRTEFWILRARATVRAVLYKCIRCTRENAKVPSELMGDLPDPRVNQASRAFAHTGVDYAGPLAVRTSSGRGHKAHKSYIALFICLTVKAIHLELVSDYSSANFLAAYQRFVSRRGLPMSMYSDNGTTFHGADREMTDAYFKAVREHNFLNQLASDRVSWHFVPPSAPHFGGLWEAGVKSVKHHLKRCIGNQTLTFEEMTTLLCRVEACLNSRPIAATSETIDDYLPLTPGHFLIGTPLIAQPEPSVLDLNEKRLSRWQIVQRITEGFWKAWSSDYLHTLQQRPKWRVIQRLARVGQMVLIRNPLAPPSQWELGRVTACHPGQDGLTRVVTVKTSRSEYKRPITKLCFLPIDINVESAPDRSMAGGVQKRDSL